MNEQLQKKIQKDTESVQKDFSALAEDSYSQATKGFEKLKGDAKESLMGAADTLKKDVGHGLSQYNAKAQEFAKKVPGDLANKAAKYPWVAISIGLGIGLLLGGMLKPSRRL
jgi:ElaB/YqjD/DUF883 family membrane-anchored ribosome-binding protein